MITLIDDHKASHGVEAIGAGQALLADRGYVNAGLRDRLAARGAIANIRQMPTRKRAPAFDPILYHAQPMERFFSKLKHFRAVTARCDKRDDTLRAPAKPASLGIWLRTHESVT